MPFTPWTSSNVFCTSALAGLCPFNVPGALLPGLVHWMRSCTVTCAVRSEGGQCGCTGLLRWAQLSGCAGTLGVPMLCLVCVTQCALNCSGRFCQRKARPSVHMEDAGDLSGRDWQD